MKMVVGIFTSRADAERAAGRLRATGIGNEQISLLAPGASASELEAIPTTETEQPGMGRAVGGVVGGAVGAAGGLQLGAAMASTVIPGVGPVIAMGLAAAALVGIGGAAVGGALEDALADGLPKDELFVYEDALRQGRSLLLVLAGDELEADAARATLVEAGTESIDAARERWWVGLRDAEAEEYAADGGDFKQDEPAYRLGFEAALRRKTQGAPYENAVEYLREWYPDLYREDAFHRGYDRGQAYHRRLRARHLEGEG